MHACMHAYTHFTVRAAVQWVGELGSAWVATVAKTMQAGECSRQPTDRGSGCLCVTECAEDPAGLS